jgi:hypothetical protein
MSRQIHLLVQFTTKEGYFVRTDKTGNMASNAGLHAAKKRKSLV